MNGQAVPARELWACFRLPPGPPPADVVALSFLRAGDEEDLAEACGGRMLRAREQVDEVRDEARAAYVELTARLAADPVLDGQRTLREAMGGRGASRWWYHPVSIRDSTAAHDPTYLHVLRLFCLLRAREQTGAEQIRLFGAPPELREALAGTLRVASEGEGGGVRSVAAGLLRGAAGRIAFVGLCWALRVIARPRAASFDVALQAHWNATLSARRDGLADAMFVNLPKRLAAHGVHCAWLAWYDGGRGVLDTLRGARSLRALARQQPGVVVAIQGLIGWRESLAEALSPRPLLAVRRALREPRFRELFRLEGLDLLPLLRHRLVVGAGSSTIPRAALAERATARAAAQARPHVLLACHELFIHSKAAYAGWREGRPGRPAWSVQHASYSPDKTFGRLHPRLELSGEPDGLAAPTPDRILAIGEADRRLWLESGFDPSAVDVLGGLRYQGVALDTAAAPLSRQSGDSVLLMLASLGTREEDLDLAEAVERASRGLPFRLVLRNHPYESAPLQTLPEFDGLRRRVEVSDASLGDDLARASLVVTAASSTANETFVRGLPTWQWVHAGPDQTSFHVGALPRFASVPELARALAELSAEPGRFTPSPELRERVWRECFGPAGGSPVSTIAAAVSAACRDGEPDLAAEQAPEWGARHRSVQARRRP